MSPWLAHLAAFRASNPDKKGKVVMSEAKATYVKAEKAVPEKKEKKDKVAKKEKPAKKADKK